MPSGVQLLRPPSTGFYYADLAAVAAQHHLQQQQHRLKTISDVSHNISPILNSWLGMIGSQSPAHSPVPSPSGSSSSDHGDAPMNKKARLVEIKEEVEEESAVEQSSPEETEESDYLANLKETMADEDLAEISVKDEIDTASEAGSHSSGGVSNSSVGAPSSEGNAGVLSCEVTIHTDNKSPTLSPNSAAIIVVTPSS
jgi:hypothetical protein